MLCVPIGSGVVCEVQRTEYRTELSTFTRNRFRSNFSERTWSFRLCLARLVPLLPRALPRHGRERSLSISLSLRELRPCDGEGFLDEKGHRREGDGPPWELRGEALRRARGIGGLQSPRLRLLRQGIVQG